MRLSRSPVPDDELPDANSLEHTIRTYLNADAQRLVKARARQLRHRSSKKPVSVHLDHDAWALLSAYSKSEDITLSEAIRRRFADPDTSC